MFRKRFLTQRPQALAQRAGQIRRLQQARRMLAETDSPFVHAQDLLGIAEDGDHEHLGLPALH